MKNGECCLEELHCGYQGKQLLIFGEAFYVQLFINYNLFHMTDIKVWRADKGLWAQGISITCVSELSEHEDIVIYCGYNQREKKEYLKFIDYDFFDMQSIRINGTFCYEGQTYIVDDVKFVASTPKYMYRAYKNITAENLSEYLQELTRAPAGRHIDHSGQICLWDYNSRLIHQKNGRRITSASAGCKKKIHIFGDSRVSGYMLEDKDLFSNILQHILNNEKIKYEVINYGIPGREIERMAFQLKKAELHTDDIVFIMTACHEYRTNSYDRQQQFALHMKKIKSICDRYHAKLCYINLPVTVEIITPNKDEQKITELYRNYKFNEYTLEKIEHFKEYLFMALSSYGIYYYDMALEFNKPHDDLLFINMHHYSPAGNKVIAEAMYKLTAVLCTDKYNAKKVKKLYENAEKNVKQYIRNEYKRYNLIRRTKISLGGGIKFLLTEQGRFRAWIWGRSIVKEFHAKKRRKYKKYGAIVMNANPFTLGHRYLVEYACRQVDHLYIFVLEEDKSEFLYDDRLHMVYLGVKDIKNVTVTSGGENVISNNTFPEYFMKKELQNSTVDAYKDIESFALNVAPIWEITERFFAEEPLDNVTRQYNEQMKRYLPQFSISATEIPRKTDKTGEVISATRVRRAIQESDWETVSHLVPVSTLRYLKTCKK